MPGQTKAHGKPVKKVLETDRKQREINKVVSGMHVRRLGGVFNSSPSDPNASQRKPLGTFDPTKGTWTPNKKKQLGS